MTWNQAVFTITFTSLSILCVGLVQAQIPKPSTASSRQEFNVLHDSHANPNTTIKEILDGYEKTIGGKQAIERIRSLVFHDEILQEGGAGKLIGSAITYFKSPNRFERSMKMSDGRKQLSGFNGKATWYESTRDGYLHVSTDWNMVAEKELNPYNRLHLRELLPEMKLTGTSRIEDKDVYILEARLDEEQLIWTLYFDSKTMDLVGSRFQDGMDPINRSNEEFYSDFRVINGVRIPFFVKTVEVVNHVGLVVRTNYEYKTSQVDCNVAVRDSLFSPPQHGAAPTPVAHRGDVK